MATNRLYEVTLPGWQEHPSHVLWIAAPDEATLAQAIKGTDAENWGEIDEGPDEDHVDFTLPEDAQRLAQRLNSDPSALEKPHG